jgi:hypothetical protein
VKFKIPKGLSGPAKLAELTRQAARPPLKITRPSVPLLQRKQENPQ